MNEQVRRIARSPLPGDTTPDLAPVQQDIRRYLNARTLREKTEAVEKVQKAILMETLAAKGKVEGDGHKVIYLDESWPLTIGKTDHRVKAIKRERRVSQQFNADAAMALVRAKGIEDECVDVVTERVLDEDKVLAANYAGKITDAEIAKLYSNKESFAFVPVKDE